MLCINFNIYSLQYFPGYPLTKKALADGYITEADVSMDSLGKRLFSTWGFAPKLFPMTQKQILQNIIWLLAYHHPGNDIVKHAVFNGSWRSALDLIYLNLKAVWGGKIRELKRIMNRKIA